MNSLHQKNLDQLGLLFLTPHIACARLSLVAILLSACELRVEPLFRFVDGGIDALTDNGAEDVSQTDAGDSSLPVFPERVWASEFHSCAAFSDHSLRCWGLNAGRLGNGSDAPSLVPVLVVGLPQLPLIDVALGYEHSCALVSDGTLFCWGANQDGQLGLDVAGPVTTPTQVGIGGMLVQQIGAGAYHTCAVLRIGSVYCWGRNIDGQLGDETYQPRLTPQPVSRLSGAAAVDVAGAGVHSCARFLDGSIQCWGDRSLGLLGDGTPTGSVSRPYPSLVSDLAGHMAVDVSAGDYQTCARFADASFRCWGVGFGEVDPAVASVVPVLVNPMSSMGVLRHSVGSSSTCAVVTDRSLWCFGGNMEGQIGNGQRGSLLVRPQRVAENVRDVSVGAEHACAIFEDNSIRCWGSNREGRLGDGTRDVRLLPAPVVQTW